MKCAHEFNLDLLTEFPGALVYGFEPEGEDIYEFKSFYSVISQFRDTLDAYLYAQNNILPTIRETDLRMIDDAQWIDWIKDLHRKIGHHLLANSNQMAGEYASSPVFRWHQGCELGNEMSAYLSQTDADISSNLDAFCARIGRSYQQSHEEFRYLIHIVQKTFHCTDLTQVEKVYPTTPHLLGANKLVKFHEAYHAGKFSEEEHVHINKVVKLSTPHHKISVAMDEMIIRFTRDLKQLDTHNSLAVAQFLAQYFYELTEIHPFVNANGRTATCFLNIILKAMGYPAILLRHPGDKENVTSLYSRAIMSIDESRDLLVDLILMRISDAHVRTYEDEHLKSLITLRVTMFTAYHNLSLQFPEFDVDTHWSEIQLKIPRVEEIQDERSPLLLEGLAWVISQIEQHKAQLIEKKAHAALKFHSSPTKEQIERIKDKLKSLSGEDLGWKAYKNGTLFLLENNDAMKIKTITGMLKKSKACDASSCMRRDTNMHVVKVENINVHLLLAYAQTSSKSVVASASI